MTPTARTLKKLAEDGWMAEEVERWIPHTRIRKDLFGVADIIAVKGRLTLLVQATTQTHLTLRVDKIKAEPQMHTWLSFHLRRIEVWAWRYLKRKARWEPFITEIYLADLSPVSSGASP